MKAFVDLYAYAQNNVFILTLYTTQRQEELPDYRIKQTEYCTTATIARSQNARKPEPPQSLSPSRLFTFIIILSDKFCAEAGRLTGTGDNPRDNQLFLRPIISNELPLANVLIFLPFVCNPDLVVELPPLLAFSMFVRTAWIQARIESTRNPDVRELAIRPGAVGAVSAHWCCGMSKGARRIGAIGEELAILFGLMVGFLSRGWMATNALLVLAGSAKWAVVRDINRSPWRRGRGLMCERTVFPCTG